MKESPKAMDKTDNKESHQCPEFPYFGAWYPDARCIDGFLWDLDKYEDGQLYDGGEEPCPFCNRESFIEIHLDEDNGDTREVIEAYISRLEAKYGHKSNSQNNGQ